MATASRETLRAEILGIDLSSDYASWARKFEFEGFDPLVTFEELKKCETNMHVLRQEMTRILVFVNSRGTLVSKATKRMGSEGKTEINRLVAKYNIQERSARAAKDVISVGRIACVFPHISAELCDKDIVRDVAPGGNLPKQLRFLQAPSLFHDTTYDNDWLEWAKRVDAVINPGLQNPERVEQFFNVMKAGDLFSTDQRKTILSRYGL